MASTKASAIRFDDFVSAVRPDPAVSEPLIMLSGYVGRSDSDGKLRIYSDASLNNWHEAAEDDVVHSSPIADSPLGGSNVWMRGTATITPGAAAPLPPEPGEGDEGQPEAARAAAAVPTIPECTQMCMPTLPPQCGPTQIRFGCLPTHLPVCPWTSTCPPLAYAVGAYNTQVGCPTIIPWTTILCQ